MITDDRLKELLVESHDIMRALNTSIDRGPSLSTILQFKISQEVALSTKSQLRGNS